ncbi:MAG: type II secretion system F family protein [archaeon]
MKIGAIYGRICKSLCELVPEQKKQKTIIPELRFAGIKGDYDDWIGKRIFAVLLAGLVGLLLPWTAGKFFGLIDFGATGLLQPAFYSAIFFISLTITLLAIFYLHLYYEIDGRTALAESILPDFLMLVASNINAGMTPTTAFRNAARKEFGPLSEEIKSATTKSLGTDSFTESLHELSKKIKSKTLEETVSFFSQSLRSGGHLAKLLETSAADLRQTQELKKELESNTRMYIIFVWFIVIIATPVLLSVSVQFLKMVKTIQATNTTQSDVPQTIAFLSTELRITPEFMLQAAYILLLLNAALSSLFIGMLSSGKARQGLRNFPLLLALSIIVFLIATTLLSQLLLA